MEEIETGRRSFLAFVLVGLVASAVPALAKDGGDGEVSGSDDGGGHGSDSDHGGDDGNSGRGGDDGNSGRGGGDDGSSGGGGDDGAAGGAGSGRHDDAVENDYDGGWRERIANGRYELFDPEGRPVINRSARQADYDRARDWR